MTDVRAVLFDLGGVIIRFPNVNAAFDRWESELGFDPGMLAKRIWGSEMEKKAVVGAISAEDMWRWIGEDLGIGDRVHAMVEDIFRGDARDEEITEFLSGLRPRYRTGILSNAWTDARSYAPRYGLDELVDDVIFSAEVGLAKPDPKVFALALERLGAAPGEAVFVDDSPEHVDAARALGMHGIHHTSAAGTIAAVRAVLAGPG